VDAATIIILIVGAKKEKKYKANALYVMRYIVAARPL
jgi:hypothetical protein